MDTSREEVYNHLKFIIENSDDQKTIDKASKAYEIIKEKDEGSEDTQKKNDVFNRMNIALGLYNRFKFALERDIDIDPGRLMGLTDGIFGMVMTLLIFGLSLPEIEILSYGDFITFLSQSLPSVGVTIVSFVLLAFFWIYHHEFIKINKLNIPYLWINMLFLISISFIPLTTSLIGNYSHFFLSEVVFGLNILITLIAFILMYYYASKRKFLEKKPSQHEKNYVTNTLIIIMLFTIIINLLDYNVSGNFIYLFVLLPVISTIRDIMFKVK